MGLCEERLNELLKRLFQSPLGAMTPSSARVLITQNMVHGPAAAHHPEMLEI